MPNKYLSLDNNNLTILPDLSKLHSIHFLDLSDNKLKEINGNYLPPNLKYLKCINNQIITIYNLPRNLICLHFSHNLVKYIDIVPQSLEYFIGDNNFLYDLPKFSDNLKHLQVSYNRLNKIPKLSKKIQYLLFYGNKINKLPELPHGLIVIAGYKNCIKNMPYIPSTITEFLMHDNNLCKIIFGKNDEDTIKRSNIIYKFNRTFYSQKINNWINKKLN